jgi:hypothetical protein
MRQFTVLFIEFFLCAEFRQKATFLVVILLDGGKKKTKINPRDLSLFLDLANFFFRGVYNCDRSQTCDFFGRGSG